MLLNALKGKVNLCEVGFNIVLKSAEQVDWVLFYPAAPLHATAKTEERV